MIGNVPAEVHARVSRLLRGDAQSSDLDRLFLWLRERPYGRWAVLDVGNFTAHWSNREQGLTWEHANDVLATIVAHMDVLQGAIDLPTLRRGIVAASALDDSIAVKRELGLSPKAAKAKARSASEKITSFDCETGDISADEADAVEWSILTRYAGVATFKPVFTQDDLTKQLQDLLEKFGLLNPAERVALRKQADLIGAYALTKMHGCVLSVTDRKIELQIGVDGKSQHLVIWANNKIDLDGMMTTIAYAVYRTKCVSDEWIDPGLLSPAGLIELQGRRIVPLI